MIKKLHWFPFYYLDWLSDSEVAMMTYSEKGLFIDMLSRCFNEGGLPADENKLLRLFKCDKNDLQECIQMFYIKDEKLFNKKLDSIQKDQRKISGERSKAGKISAEKRKAKRLTTSTSVEQVLNFVTTNDQQNSTSTVQNNTEEKKVIKSKPKTKVFVPPTYEEFLKYCKAEGFSNIAERAFKGYQAGDWHDAKGSKIIRWKQKLQNGWFKSENKDAQIKPQQIRQFRP